MGTKTKVLSFVMAVELTVDFSPGFVPTATKEHEVLSVAGIVLMVSGCDRLDGGAGRQAGINDIAAPMTLSAGGNKNILVSLSQYTSAAVASTGDFYTWGSTSTANSATARPWSVILQY